MEEVVKSLIEQLMRLGFTEEQALETIAGLTIVKKGTIHGHAHLEDIPEIVDKTLHRQNAKAITLKISKEGDEDSYNGHLEIEIMDVEKPLR